MLLLIYLIKNEWFFIKGDLMAFGFLSVNGGVGEGKGWKVECSVVGMWRLKRLKN